MRITALIVGVILTLATFLALCQAMLVPRQSNSLIVRAVNSVVSAAAQAPLPLMRSYRMQDRWLSGAAPMTVLIALVAYVVILIATLGLVVYGTTQLSLLESMYQSGSTLTTLGIVEPVNVPSAITTFIAAFLGLVVIAVFIGYLLAIYGAYVARESGMARVAMLAGEPAWGPVMIARGHLLGLPDKEVPDASEWLNWICDTRLNSQVNPVLMRFRSTSGLRHWVTTTLAVMDAATLRVSTSDSAPDPHLVQVLTEGTLSLATVRGNWGNECRAPPQLGPGAQDSRSRRGRAPRRRDCLWRDSDAVRQRDGHDRRGRRECAPDQRSGVVSVRHDPRGLLPGCRDVGPAAPRGPGPLVGSPSPGTG